MIDYGQGKSDCNAEALWPILCEHIKADVKAWDDAHDLVQVPPVMLSSDGTVVLIKMRHLPGLASTKEVRVDCKFSAISFTVGAHEPFQLFPHSEDGKCLVTIKMGGSKMSIRDVSLDILQKAGF